MSRLRIVHLLEASAGGSGLQVRRLALAQAAAGHRVTVVLSARRSDCDFAAQLVALRDGGCETLEMTTGRWPGLGDLKLIGWLRTVLASRQAEVLHTHCAKAGFLGRLAVRSGDEIQCFHTPHSWYLHGLRGLKRAAAIRLERFLAGRSDGLICISEDEALAAVQWRLAPATKVSVVANGLPVDFVAGLLPREAARQQLGVPSEAVVIGAFARLAKRKELGRLVRALPALPPEMMLVLVGEGAEELRLRELARELGVTARVRFCGYQADAGRLVRGLDVAALPSRWEGRSLFALEVLAAGVPLVLADVPGNRFAATAGARLVGEDDDAGWVTAIAAAATMAPLPSSSIASVEEQAQTLCEVYQRTGRVVDAKLGYSRENRQVKVGSS